MKNCLKSVSTAVPNIASHIHTKKKKKILMVSDMEEGMVQFSTG